MPFHAGLASENVCSTGKPHAGLRCNFAPHCIKTRPVHSKNSTADPCADVDVSCKSKINSAAFSARIMVGHGHPRIYREDAYFLDIAQRKKDKPTMHTPWKKTAIRNFTGGLALALIVIPSGQIASATDKPAVNDPITEGEWGAPFDIGITAIHSTLLQSGKVLVWESTNGPSGGSHAVLWDPSGTLTDVSVPYDRDIFCGGQVHMADGRLMVIGGVVWQHAGSQVGVVETDFFDATTETWSPGPNMSEKRWYPGAIECADGKILAIGGWEDTKTMSTTMELYDPATNAFTTLPQTADKNVWIYPRTVLLKNGKVFMAGQNQDTNTLDFNTNTWSFTGNFNYGKRFIGMTVLLPGLSQVMAIGGGVDVDELATETAEIIDFSQPTPSWSYTTSMEYPRVHANAVLLPDGKVLVVGGCHRRLAEEPVAPAELFDPVSQTWTEMAELQALKAHHSTALLLPDGRVWSAGGDQRVPLQTYAQIYSPPYLFKGARPIISRVPQTIAYRQSFSITTADAANITRVALIKLGATTHDENFDQRYVDLAFQKKDGRLKANSPGDGKQAPPGYYMLFIVNGDGVPSVASMVQLQ